MNRKKLEFVALGAKKKRDGIIGKFYFSHLFFPYNTRQKRYTDLSIVRPNSCGRS